MHATKYGSLLPNGAEVDRIVPVVKNFSGMYSI